MLKKKLMGIGFPAGQANQLAGQGEQGLTATGTNQATGLVIGSGLNSFSTVAASTGATITSTMVPGDDMYVYNGGANTLTIYPNGTDTFQSGGSTATSLSLVAGKGVYIRYVATGLLTTHTSA